MRDSIESDTMRQLTELLARVSASRTEKRAAKQAVTITARVAQADFAVLIRNGAVAAATGFDGGTVPVRELSEAARQGTSRCELPGLGRRELASAALEGEPAGWLVVGRADGAFAPAGGELVAAVAHVLTLTLQVLRAAEGESDLRRHREDEIRERRRVQRELAHQAVHDRLTGLPNRNLMRDRAQAALNRARHEAVVAALFVDIDHFKVANDALDHAHGDQLLVMIAHRLQSVVAALSREDDGPLRLTLGRHGGDEFIVLGEALGSERGALVVAEQLRDAMRAPFGLDGRPVNLTASVGIACATGAQAQAGRLDADGLLRDADTALARAKEFGRDRCEIFDEQMRIELLHRAALEADLRAGVERGELRLLYQPVLAAADERLVAVEALVRWQHPTRGLLGPGEFIALAEESDLIVAIGTWVIDEACAQIRRWSDAHPAKLGVRVSVNVSARQLSPELVTTVEQALARHGVHPSQLVLEITESLLIEQTERAREVLARLKAAGVAVVLDDFGTGYSSLGYLNEFRLDQLKLDRSFTAELGRDPRSAKIVAATIEMGRALGMTVVAEGVETSRQLDVLKRLGCDYVQGFLFARPEPAAAIFDRVRTAYEADRALAATPPVAVRLASSVPAFAPEPAAVADAHDRRTLGRLAGVLFIMGGTLAIPADLAMGAPSVLATVLLTLMGVVTGLVCLTLPWERVPSRWLQAVAAMATLEVTCSTVVDGRHGSVLNFFYVLVAVAIAYAFRDRRIVAAQMALMAAAMALPPLLVPHQPPDAVSRMLIAALVTVSVAGVIVYLREQLEGSAARMRELAGRDPLTEVGNYRLLHERLRLELERHQQTGASFAVLLIDLDRFKHVNERLGHAAGDDVLRRVALTLRDAVRQHDTVARQGGDEFAVLAPVTDAEGAAMLAARIRDRLRLVQFAGDNVDATIGWALYPSDGDTAQTLLAQADGRLLAAKHSPGHAVTAALTAGAR
ncbi:MAG TPA: EAL domain-containing protein [Solirubrobacteraceae bacterium]|nr:EAL domain-containing protein [Solirubrobacteraceae bacterium]